MTDHTHHDHSHDAEDHAKPNEFRLSFEFFPAKTDVGRSKLAIVQKELASINPDFFSVTYGAGGSTRDNTKGLVKTLRDADIAAAPHLSFGGDTEETILPLLQEYKDMGVNRLVALRGDVPSGIGGSSQLVYANELVTFVKKHFGDHFHLEVAAYPEIHPEANSYDEDIHYLKGKFDAGANSAITQYFFNVDAYFHFAEQCDKAGIKAPIYPGIMPILNYKNLARFSDACGADIPRWIRKKLEGYGDDTESLKAFGVEWISEMCDTLLDAGVPGLHFYTMNTTDPTRTIIENLGLEDSPK